MALSINQAFFKANSLLKKGNNKEAIELFQSILQREPKNKRVLAILELIDKEALKPLNNPDSSTISPLIIDYNKKNYIAVSAAATKLLESYPESDKVLNILGMALSASGRKKAAIRAFERALALNPSEASIHNNIGNALVSIRRLPEAITHLRKAVSLKEDFTEAYFSLGVALNANGEFGDAIDAYKKVISLNDRHEKVYNNIANSFRELGDDSRSAEFYIKSAEIFPRLTSPHRNYASLKKMTPDDPMVALIRGRLSQGDLSPDEEMNLSFAMGKVEIDLGNFESGFQYIERANLLNKEATGYEVEVDVRFFSLLKSQFQNIDSSSQRYEYGVSPFTPIFILGMPRSGTSLVEKIVGAHSQVHAAGELEELSDALRASGWPSKAPTKQSLESIRRYYSNRVSKLSSSQFITDKMPLNFRYIGFIAQAFPEAKILRLKRNPAAVCWSNYKLYFPAKGMRFTYSQTDIALYHKLYEELMEFWHETFPGRILDVDYEKLTEDQEVETRRILECIGLEWEQDVLDFHLKGGSMRTASREQVRKKIYQGSSEEWRKFEPWLGPMLNVLGR